MGPNLTATFCKNNVLFKLYIQISTSIQYEIIRSNFYDYNVIVILTINARPSNAFDVSGQNSPIQNSPKLQKIRRQKNPRQNSPKKADKIVPDKIVPRKQTK